MTKGKALREYIKKFYDLDIKGMSLVDVMRNYFTERHNYTPKGSSVVSILQDFLEHEDKPIPMGLATVLFEDGTLIINELPSNRVNDIVKHGAIVGMYAPCSNDNPYVFDRPYQQPWNEKRNSIKHVEFGESVALTSTAFLFVDHYNLESVDFTNLDTSSVTTMRHMFDDCTKLSALDVTSFDTSSVVDMSYMFYNCSLLTELNLTSFDTGSVTDMSGMFRECSALTTIDVSNDFDVSGVTTSENMFGGCTSLIGSGGTAYDPSHTDKTYAKIDDGASNPGYFSGDSWDINDYATVLFEDGHLMINEKKSNRAADEAVHGAVTNEYAPWDKKNPDTSYVFKYPVDIPWINQKSSITSASFGSLFQPHSTAYLFGLCTNLTSVNVDNLDMSFVTSALSMFASCKITSLDVSNWNLERLTIAASMFTGCGSLITLDVSNWNVESLTNAGGMFYNCSNLETLDVSAWDTRNITNTSTMFYQCSKLETVDVSNWNVESLTNASRMFYGCSNLTQIDVSKWNISNRMIYTDSMFYGCSNLTTLDVSNWNTSAVTDTSYMFNNCQNLTTIYSSNKFVTTQITNSTDMFNNCTKLIGGAGTVYDSAKIDKEYACIDNPPSAPGYFTLKEDWDINDYATVLFADGHFMINEKKANRAADEAVHGAVTNEYIPWDKNNPDTSYVFTGASQRPWDGQKTNIKTVSAGSLFRPKSTAYMFKICYNLTTIDVSNWDTSALTSAYEMFSICRNLTTIDVSNWDTSALVSAESMFRYCQNLTTLAVSNWETSALEIASYMFDNCQGLTTLDVSNWDTSALTDAEGMFSGCSNLTTIYASSAFVVSQITASTDMFSGCTSLVGGAGTPYDSSKTDKEYARIDNLPSELGYFTLKTN